MVTGAKITDASVIEQFYNLTTDITKFVSMDNASGFLDLSNVVAIGVLGIALVCSIIASITSLIENKTNDVQCTYNSGCYCKC